MRSSSIVQGRGAFLVRVGAVGAAVLAATATAVVASPQGWIFDRPIQIHHPRPALDVRPSNLEFTAYQADDSVIVIASGVNTRGGFSTTLCDVDERGDRYVVTMHNRTEANRFGTACLTPFNVVASFRTHDKVNCVRVELGRDSFEVPVTHAPRIR